MRHKHTYNTTTMPTKKPLRKTVSFLAATRQSTDEVPKDVSVSVPGVKKSLLVVPFHLLLTLYGMFHYGLTEDPFGTMVKGLVNLYLVQFAYAYLYATVLVEKGKKKKSDDNVFLLVISSTVISALLANGVFIVLILFGAPLASHLKETYLLACHLSLIVFQPLLVLYKLDYEQFFALASLDKIYRAIFSHPALSSSFFAILGAWLGVIPIPLDWDRPWQQWPITILTGGYVGAFAGVLVSLVPLC